MPRHFSFERPHRKGTELSPEARKEALCTFVHRYTGEHVPAWARKPRPDGQPYYAQFRDDADWLENTLFNVKKDGSLANASCWSVPMWPKAG